jgi:hypothetical protein
MKTEYIVEIVKALVWPVVAGGFCYAFRDDIRQFLSRISQVEYKNLKVDLSRAREVAEIGGFQKEKFWVPQMLSKPEVNQLVRIAKVSPRAAIMEAWFRVESAVEKATFIIDNDVSPRTLDKVQNYLVKSGKLPPTSLGLIETLRDLRDGVAHMPDFALNYAVAEQYIELAVWIAETIKEEAKKVS